MVAKLREINVDLNRQYRDDLNWNFRQIEAITGMSASDIARVERESKERDNLLAGTDVEAIIQRIDTSANNADVQAQHAKVQGDYTKGMGDYAKQQGDYASQKGDYADEKAVLADRAAANASNEASNLSQLKVDVMDATQRANAEADSANRAASDANTAATYANEQGDYAKTIADSLVDTDVGELTIKINEVNNNLTTLDDKVTTHLEEEATENILGHVRQSENNTANTVVRRRSNGTIKVTGGTNAEEALSPIWRGTTNYVIGATLTSPVLGRFGGTTYLLTVEIGIASNGASNGMYLVHYQNIGAILTPIVPLSEDIEVKMNSDYTVTIQSKGSSGRTLNATIIRVV